MPQGMSPNFKTGIAVLDLLPGPKLQGFCQVARADRRCPREIGDGPGYFYYAGDAPNA